jgi:hypothetical protein
MIKKRENGAIKYNVKDYSRAEFHPLISIKEAEVITKIVDGKPETIKKTKQKKHRINHLLDSNLAALYFPIFGSVRLISNNPLIFSLFKPPEGKLIPGMIHRLIILLRSRVFNPRAFDELLSSHSTRPKNPNIFISKFFIHFSTEPHTGKSLLSHLLSLIYGPFGCSAATVENVEDQFNSWQKVCL